jgi:uncharacterized membrane protein
MIYFHIVFDMSSLYGYSVSVDSGINFWIGKVAGYLFIILAAVSCRFSRRNFRRGLRILGWALVLSVVTHLFDPVQGIKFGILHFLGLSILLHSLFNRMQGFLLAMLGSAILIAGYLIRNVGVPFDWFFFLGLKSINFSSGDYYPFIPYLGIFLWGMLLGRWLYPERKSLFSFTLPLNPVSTMGRHTLLIYLLHQPVILGILALVSRWRGI